MRKIIAGLVLFASLVFLVPAYADISKIKEGTYKGRITFNCIPGSPQDKAKVFIVVASGNITGLSGESPGKCNLIALIDQTSLKGDPSDPEAESFNFTVSRTTLKFKSAVKSSKIIGSARLVKGSDKITSPYYGYYTNVNKEGLIKGGGVPESINVGPDGSVVVIVGRDQLVGKINSSGQFEQFFLTPGEGDVEEEFRDLFTTEFDTEKEEVTFMVVVGGQVLETKTLPKLK